MLPVEYASSMNNSMRESRSGKPTLRLRPGGCEPGMKTPTFTGFADSLCFTLMRIPETDPAVNERVAALRGGRRAMTSLLGALLLANYAGRFVKAVTQ